PDLLLRLEALRGRGVIGADTDRAAVARVRRTAQALRARLARELQHGAGGSTQDDARVTSRRARGAATGAGSAARAAAGVAGTPGAGALLALAWPDRIGRARGGRGAFVLRNGRGARVPPHSALAAAEWIVAAAADAQ